ncbi:transposase IS204/IS1001/IS1096/IS1165 family protein [Crinalium epipsammum PCC 9333]|uniref:Transposase IS204/IS1001/IS1096/IS1165 family protein n=1 Tax=Crinalium epipsammum PCC 9333 TaxID=1173022 RepID=K9VZE2_9CYAN|nr:ISL3 family transposase [Crinalium epipsammum]AFZ13488.1 transposase IS204/IS1001/IS1096/IS1165 family protein [Crinalium epipsammum PCC 9333]
MNRLITKLINLPGVIVEDSLETESTLILSVRLEKKTARCPRCGHQSHRLHQNKRHLVKDLPMGNREVILRVNRRRFKCEKCQKPFSESLNFVEPKKNCTNRYAKTIIEQVIHSDVDNVAKNNKLSSEEVWSMVMTVSEKILPINTDSLRRLGIDEISLVKGQGKFIVVLVDLETQKLVGLVSERTQLAIKKVMLKWGEKVLSQIKEVSMDMTGNYKSLVNQLCPNADVTIDRFHVSKIVHKELNQARIAQKKTAESLNTREKVKLFNNLKGSKYILLKAERNLSQKQKEKLLKIKEASPQVGIMHSLKEEFHYLFEKSENLGEGTLKLIDWIKRAEPYYHKSVATIKRWLGEIVGYFEQRTTNGIVEGINNKLKLGYQSKAGQFGAESVEVVNGKKLLCSVRDAHS